jgi:hypothetical protein
LKDEQIIQEFLDDTQDFGLESKEPKDGEAERPLDIFEKPRKIGG